MPNDDPVVQAIYDLARITLAMSPELKSRADAIRKLSELGIPASRVAMILNVRTNDVTSTMAKARKKASAGENENG